MSLENTVPRLKDYVGISLDHSASMRGLTELAARDYNQMISDIKTNAIEFQQDIIVSRVNCGYGSTANVSVEVQNSSVSALEQIPEHSYEANGRGTPLFDSVGLLIDIFEKMPDAGQQNVSFLINIITDGGENASQYWSARKLSQKIQALQATDRWTFVFRTPRGYSGHLINQLGLFPGNVQEWDQTKSGFERSTVETSSAMNGYFTARSQGKTAVRSFYANIKDLSSTEVKAQLTDISSQVTLWKVQTEAEASNIREFVEHKLGDKMLKGAAFYSLVGGKKSADKVQASKLILIRDKTTGVIYFGSAARDLIGLSKTGDVKVRPGDLGNWELFIQSTSVNRKLSVGTELIYWPAVGKHFKAGQQMANILKNY